jgi:hypothetical protein
MSVLSGVRADASLSELRANERRLLGALALLGLVLRVAYQHERSWTGDEVGTLVYMQESAGYILSHFATWLTMNYFILLEKGIAQAFGSSPWVLTALPLAASVCAIPLTVALALRFCSARAALIAGALAAVNPYLVEHGPVIRSNSLLVALTLVTLLLFLRWHARPTRGRAAASATAATAVCLLHPAGVYVLAGIGALALAHWVARARAGALAEVRAEVRSLGLAFVVAGVVLVLAYARLVEGIRAVNARCSDTPPTSLDYVPYVFGSYFAHGFSGLPALLFLALGTWAATQAQRQLLVLWSLLLVPICLLSWQGVASTPWAFGRYLIFALPFLLVLVAAGIDLACRALGEKAWLGWGLTCLVALSWVTELEERFEEKRELPWMRLTGHLAALPAETAIVAQGLRDDWQLRPLEIETGRGVLKLSELLMREPGPEGLRIVYVNSYEPIQTTAECETFGRIQAITYQADTLRDLVTRLHADLLQSARERAGSELEPLYEGLVATSEFLGSRRDVERFRLLRGWSHQFNLRAQALKVSRWSAVGQRAGEFDPDQ